MNNSFKTASQILAAGLAGVVLLTLAIAPVVAALSGEIIFAIAASAAIIGVAINDYTRQVQSLGVPCRVERLVLPAAVNRRGDSGGLKSDHDDCIAA